MFSDTSRKVVSENLSKGEGKTLINWRKRQLYNPCGDLVLRSKDKENRFVIAHKETDKMKAEEEIKCSILTVSYDSTLDHVAKVKVWNKNSIPLVRYLRNGKIIYTLSMFNQVKTLRITRRINLVIPCSF